MSRPTRRRAAPAAALALTALVLAATPGVALAQTPDEGPRSDRSASIRAPRAETDAGRDLEAAKARIIAAIDRRLEALERLAATVDESPHLSAAHAARLHNDIRAAARLLEQAKADVAAAQTAAEVRAIVPEVFHETLVFALLGPKTHLVVASASVGARAERMGEFAETLETIIDRLAGEGYDMNAARDALAEMVRLAAAASASAEPVADGVIGLGPDDWPDPAAETLADGRAALAEARASLRLAAAQARATVLAIREALAAD